MSGPTSGTPSGIGLTTFKAIPEQVRRKLWEHQAVALTFAVEHLNAHAGSCLIRMPTGTGKTGVVACLSMISNPATSLVLTPWANLRDQMVADLKQGFWDRVEWKPPVRAVSPILPSSTKSILDRELPQVLVATFATLNDLRRRRPGIYKSLAERLSLVIVDECHYEPAVEWGRSVKELGVRTVLLTATPYRNDLRLFRITDMERSTHHYTHRQAEQSEIIRRLAFATLEPTTEIPSLASSFANQWKALKRSKALPSATPRAIVCCANAVQIAGAVAAFHSHGLKAIGVHEQFEGTPDTGLFREVPDPRSTDAAIWVHQHKLTEGLDDHRFCCLALFTQIRNDRKLVQQIGRILRRHPSDRRASALLLSPPMYSPESSWMAYRRFEMNIKLLGPAHFRDVVEGLLEKQPEVEYFDGRFRQQFRPRDLANEPQVLLLPSVLVRVVGETFNLSDYIEVCTDTLNTQDGIILGPDTNGPCRRGSDFALWVYASVRNSKMLKDTSLYEVALQTHCVVKVGAFVFLTDSTGTFPDEYLDESTGTVDPEALRRYLDKSFRLTSISMDSAIPYDTVLRGADVHGHNLLTVAASLTDHVQICRAARGSSRQEGRRYVGIDRGRVRREVSEQARRRWDLEAFMDWTESVAGILGSKTEPSPLFSRYMQTCPAPALPVPRTICLNLQRFKVELKLQDGTECHLTRSAADIVASDPEGYRCSFEVDANGDSLTSITLGLQYVPNRKRFQFTRKGGVVVNVSEDDGEQTVERSIQDYLNNRQDIVLIGLDGGEIVYQGRNFYKVDYGYAERVLLGTIRVPEGVPACRTENGDAKQIARLRKSRRRQFPPASLFRAIAMDQIGLPFKAELLICDDKGTECADFIAANLRERKLALIHAKAGPGARVSASAFHDVVAQAMKNLVYLTRNGDIPSRSGAWRSSDTWNRTAIPRLYRTREGLPMGKALWRQLKRDIIDVSNPELYVILVTTGCCDKSELGRAVNDRAARTPETAQLLHLLDGLNGHARQLGVRLMVQAVPYLVRAPRQEG